MVQTSGVNSWSTTPATNAGADSSINFAEGQAPSSVNDSARALMARVADWRDSLNGSKVTAGSSTAYTLTSGQTFTALDAGLEVAFQIDEVNGATVTLNVDSQGAKPLRSAAGVELVAGALKAGAVYRATYFTSNSGEWLLHDFTPTIIATDQVVTASIAADQVTYAKMQNVSATKRALGRNTSGSGDVEEVTAPQILNWLGTPARGDIIRQGASDPERLAKGAANTVLTSDGTDPAWVLPAMVKLATVTPIAVSETSFTSLITSTYRKYVFVITNLVPATNDVQLFAQISTNAGSSWESSSYQAVVGYLDAGTGHSYSSSTSGVPISFTGGASLGVRNSGTGWSGAVELIAPSTSFFKQVNIVGGSYQRGDGAAHAAITGGSGLWTGTTAVTGIRFFFNSGNIASGTIAMYGVV